ncbi:NAD-dependent epimerase/dehydratase family protein [Aliarcobacter cryaerophilus]|uniref:NAD-dependent epimerase/dehydratase family protein n=1 Tax=Aliarcobacter cryaerophilus TaxID=28198 RepID=UPI0021B511CD|nr:NAD(P)-dependent oxidoreductase [Aliarcobacter cryaerophilus]MCT7519023.1 NAD(P)-dependent oxidoreductase [Aliarcobacter cryaerophilus]
MNILITGSGGFIGSNLVNDLKKDHFIFELYNGKEYCFKGNKIICNMQNNEHIKKLLNENIKVDIVIHTASILGTKDNINNISLFYDNIKMYENLILIINKFNPSRVINFSSIAVYPNKDGNFSEISEIKPSENTECLYGLSKFCGENILDFFLKEKNICMIHLRISQVYGKGMREDRIMKVMEKELKETNKITVFGMGKRISNFIKIESLVEKIKLLLNCNSSNIFNMGEENISYKELAERIIKQYGNKDSKIELVDKGVSSKTFINSEKLKNMEIKYEL